MNIKLKETTQKTKEKEINFLATHKFAVNPQFQNGSKWQVDKDHLTKNYKNN